MHSSFPLEEVDHTLEGIVIEGDRTMVATGNGDEVLKHVFVLQWCLDTKYLEHCLGITLAEDAITFS